MLCPRAQLSVVSVLNTVYKVLVVYTGIALTMVFTKRDALIQQWRWTQDFVRGWCQRANDH